MGSGLRIEFRGPRGLARPLVNELESARPGALSHRAGSGWSLALHMFGMNVLASI
jgi:hypothetical protein